MMIHKLRFLAMTVLFLAVGRHRRGLLAWLARKAG